MFIVFDLAYQVPHSLLGLKQIHLPLSGNSSPPHSTKLVMRFGISGMNFCSRKKSVVRAIND
jgi:hypothetical protein